LILTPEYFCSHTIKVCEEMYKPISMEDDIRRILSGMPQDAHNFVNRMYEEIAADPEKRETIKFIQFSDAHLDLMYQ
jgi:2-hydroxy-3-keto-5-methylthiopentenyl-1-phosphate phosphatase